MAPKSKLPQQRETDPLFIDIHAHAYRAECPVADGYTKFATPEEVLQRYDELGIERGVLLPLIGPECYLPQSNEDILDMCRNSGGRLIPFCNLDPRGLSNAPDAPFDIWLKHYRDQGCKGIGEVMPNLPFTDSRCQNLFRYVEAIGFPLIFDISSRIGGCYGFYDDQGLPQLENTLRCFPKLFRRYPNLFGDLSAGSGYNALTRNSEYAVRFLNEFQDRLLFGTDICSAAQKIRLPAFLRQLLADGKISSAVFAKIARGNALLMLGMTD